MTTGYFEKRINRGCEPLGKCEMIDGVFVQAEAESICVDEPIPLLLKRSEAWVAWMTAFDKQDRLIRCDGFDSASQNRSLVSLDVDLDEVDRPVPGAFVVEGDKRNRDGTGADTEMLFLKGLLIVLKR